MHVQRATLYYRKDAERERRRYGYHRCWRANSAGMINEGGGAGDGFVQEDAQGSQSTN